MQLLPALDGGGVERSTLEIAQALVAAGDRSLVVSAGGRLLPSLTAMGAEHIDLPIGRKSLASLRHVLGLRRLIRERRPDIVHARSRLPAWLGWWALRGLPAGQRPRFITTVHGLNTVGRYSAIMTRGERVIAVSQTVREHLRRHYPVGDAQVTVIPRGIDPARWPRGHRPDPAWLDAVTARFPVLAGRRWLLLPGRGTRLKGHADAIALLARLDDDSALILLGADVPERADYLAELRAQAQRLGVADRLVITWPRDDVRDFMASAALVLQLSSRPEAFGRTVIEALALGRPVLGWSHGGVGELLTSLYPSGAIRPGDGDALVRRAGELLRDPPPVPMHDYTLARMQAATLALYRELADGNTT